MRSMVRRSTKVSADEEFAVAVRAGDRGVAVDDPCEAERSREGCDLFADAPVQLWIPHDALLDLARVTSNCGLIRATMSAGRAASERGGQDMLQRDEADIDGDDTRRLGQPAGRARECRCVPSRRSPARPRSRGCSWPVPTSTA